MTASPHRRFVAALLPFAAAAISACGESTTPFDAVALSQNTDEIVNVMDNSPAMQSMDVLGQKMTAGAPALGAAAFLAATIPGPTVTGEGFATWASRRLQAFQAAVPTLAAAPEGVVIPDLIESKTFTYDVETGAYVLSDREGAPANGVRFMLYAVNTLTHSVAEPLNEIGCADLTDESTSTTALQLHLKAYVPCPATSGSTALIDYTASATVTTTGPTVTSGTVTVVGYVSDGTTQVEFDLNQQISTSSGIHVEYGLAVPEKDVDVTFEATFTLTQQATVMLTVNHGGNTTVVAVSGTQASITGNIKHNDAVVMNISGSPINPVFTNPSGNPPTSEQAAALHKLFDFADTLLDHVDEMLAPALHLLGLASFFA